MNYSKFKTLLLKRFNIPKDRATRRLLKSFTEAERVVFYILITVFILSGLSLVWNVNSAYLVEVPIKGGKLVEGVVGNPRFINPVLAISEADKNLTSLVYSGLVRVSSDKNIVNDLAESISVTSDGLNYTVRIRDDVHFHDGEPVKADDVIFTIQKIVDPSIKSPRRGNWDGIAVEKIDDLTVSFHLKRPYSPFLENLTLGILPRHIWKDLTEDEFIFSQFNTLPIGSGPYVVDRVERSSGGIPNYYALKPFKDSSEGGPYIEKLIFRFYPNENSLVTALNRGEIESMGGISPERAIVMQEDGVQVISSPLPRVFGVFFNQNKSRVFLNKEVRQALDLASPKQAIVQNILNGYGTAIDGPLPSGIFSWSGERAYESEYEERFIEAQDLLEANGWEADPETGILEKKSGKDTIRLSFSISTGDASELKAVADELALAWRKLGAEVEILVFETGELNQSVIRPREFESLLFGEVVGRDADVYPFWHSSQRNDPGLNIALYANTRVDKLLEDARTTSDSGVREEKYKAFYDEIRADMPAVFLYSPSFLYVIPEKVESVALGGLGASHDRFQDIRNWYIETDKVWQIFTNN